jgi:hypothetical protein
MTTSLAAIHVARKQLGLDEDTYRALALRVTGKSSAGAMTEGERGRLLEELRKRGFKKASSLGKGSGGVRKKLEGRFAPKLQALWIAAWNLGIVDNRDDRALIAFVKRQTKVDHVRFLHDAEDAAKAIEALKGWMARAGGVDWNVSRFLPAWTQVDGYRIAAAQFRRLQDLDPTFSEFAELQHFVFREIDPDFKIGSATDRDWQLVMNALGARIRKAVR